MKSRTQIIIASLVTAGLMALMVVLVYLYSKEPDNGAYMMGMGMLSMGMMAFLMIFALVYTKPDQDPSARYKEMYQGICSRCDVPFGEDGRCPKCGRERPRKE